MAPAYRTTAHCAALAERTPIQEQSCSAPQECGSTPIRRGGGWTLNNAAGITGTGNALTVGGTGDTIIGTTGNSSGINTSTGGTLTKDGSGTLTIRGASTYTA